MDSGNGVKVSILVLTFNSSKYIAEALNSVLNQDFKDMEVIVGDDASSDQTVEIVELIKHSTKIPVKLLTANKNMGISLNFNRCLDECNGEYIFLLGGDDVFLPGKIKAQVDFMDANKDIAISYHDVTVFESDSGKHLYFYNKDRHGFHTGNAGELVTQGTFNCGCATAVRNINLPRCDQDIKFASDWLWYVDILADSGKEIRWFSGVYARYRRHDNNITSKSSIDKQYSEVMLTIDKIKDKHPCLASQCRVAYSERRFVFALKYFIENEYLKSFKLTSNPWLFFVGAFYFLKRRLLKRVC